MRKKTTETTDPAQPETTDQTVETTEAVETPTIRVDLVYCDRDGNEIDRESREAEIVNGRVVITITHMTRQS